MAGDIIPLGQFKDLSKRKLFNKTCRLFGYHVTELKGQRVQVADYRNSDGEVVFQKVRFPDKSFTCRGNQHQTFFSVSTCGVMAEDRLLLLRVK